MSPPRRRSSRLRGSYSSPVKPNAAPSRRLSCLAERDETQTFGVQPGSNATISSLAIPRTPATDGRIRPPFEEMHPGKAHSTSSPSFDLRYAHPTPTLGPDAQRMMDEIREEALRIKAQLAAQREEEKRKEVLESKASPMGRRIATPKGKIGRFSDVHLAEFKKMDSIAGHASAFRAQPGRFVAEPKYLKRSQSKAKLDGHEEECRSGNISSEPQSMENTPSKRARLGEKQHSSQPINSNPYTSKLCRSQSILGSITTPTQASLARAASIKKQNQTPAPFQSPSKAGMTAPQRLTKSATLNNMGGMLRSQSIKDMSTNTSKLDRFKTMLRRPIIGTPKPLISNQTSNRAVTYRKQPNLDKELPSIPSTPVMDRQEDIEHTNITPRSAARNISTVQNTPSPLKLGQARSKSSMRLGDIQYPSLEPEMAKGSSEQIVKYPTLATASFLPEAPIHTKGLSPPPSVPGTFTFRSDQTINFGSSPRGFGACAGQSSIRQVRPSIFPSTVPASSSSLDGNKENLGGFYAIPHGLSNKKRRRADSDDEEMEKEIRGSPLKRHKGFVTGQGTIMDPEHQPQKVARKSKIPSPSKKGVLSLTRLNMLARPKLRK